MQRENGLQTAGGHYIQVWVVSNGCHKCGLVESISAQILPMRTIGGSQKIVRCQILKAPNF